MWFGKKQKKTLVQEKISAHIQVIPEIFYGGRDPEIRFSQSRGDNKKNPPKISWPKSSGVSSKIGSFFANKWVRYLGLALFFLLAITVITLYYLQQAGIISLFTNKDSQILEETTPAPLTQEQVPVVATEPEPVEEVSTTTVSEILEEVVTTTVFTPVLQFPQIFLTDSADNDNDSLTDIEEEVFGTDPGVWDTDGDGYYDGQEVLNLYNPLGTAPMKIIDSGVVQEYINPVWQYRFYYPVNWQVGTVDPTGNQVLVSAVTGDFIEVLAFKKLNSESFQDWFAVNVQGQNFMELGSFTNRFQENGYRRQDNLVMYFDDGNNIFVLIYHPGTTGFISFRHVMTMLGASFRPNKTLVEIPEQVILPATPDFTTVTNTAF